jgi:hypothetical protein
MAATTAGLGTYRGRSRTGARRVVADVVTDAGRSPYPCIENDGVTLTVDGERGRAISV